jgi:hypothetical protein
MFHPQIADACCLCGDTAAPTGEHKIKASSLRDQFGTQPMVIVREDEPPVPARGPKSKLFHFEASMCGPCNNHRTQSADLEWDRFRRAALEIVAAGGDPVEAFEAPRYAATGSTSPQAYLDVLRYLAKLLCAHMAASGAPRSSRLTRFVLGESDDCPIHLGVIRDQTYAQNAERQGDHSYAAHGGLVLFGVPGDGAPTAFYSALTVGGLQCTITYRLTPEERQALALVDPVFLAHCAALTERAVVKPLPHSKQVQLGLAERSVPD